MPHPHRSDRTLPARWAPASACCSGSRRSANRTGPALGVVVDGCPPRLALDRRADPGRARSPPARAEPAGQPAQGSRPGRDPVRRARRRHARHADRDADPQRRTRAARTTTTSRSAYRPSHADYTYDAKYGIRAVAGGGRASARETAGRVAAGAIAQQLLARARRRDRRVGRRGRGHRGERRRATRSRAPTSTPTTSAAPTRRSRAKMIERVERARKDGDSVGGVIRAIARGVPAGWGEPVFDKLDADLAKAMMSHPGGQGRRDRLGLRRHAADRQRAQRPVLSARRRRDRHAHQPLRRHPGRHLERRADHAADRVQADRDDHAAAGHRRSRRQPDGARAARAATIRACCRARCRSSRRCSRSCSPITAAPARACSRRPRLDGIDASLRS